MAYVLGFFVADGCITISKNRENNPYTFNITSVDLEHLYNIKKVLNSDYKVGKKSNGRGNVAYQISIRNSVLAQDLMDLGIFPRKTYNLKPVKVPQKYFADFVRGFFDGDGSVYIYHVNIKLTHNFYYSIAINKLQYQHIIESDNPNNTTIQFIFPLTNKGPKNIEAKNTCPRSLLISETVFAFIRIIFPFIDTL